jgi:uncharacterized damage-inducible protein DinB
MTPDLEALRYPIGSWQSQDRYSSDEIGFLVQRIRDVPGEYAAAVSPCGPDDLGKTYRSGSWTVRQLVHHVADTHAMHLVRFKHALTEPGKPAVMGLINDWAALEEARTAPVADSLLLLDGLHRRIAYLVETLSPAQLALTYYHPGRQRDLTLAQAISIVVWHAEHHLAHIRLALGAA